MAEADVRKRYPLGVLFVHGIGEQPMGETLKNVVDPLVRSLDLWVHGAVRCRALSLGRSVSRVWADGAPPPAGGPERHAALRELVNEMAESVHWPKEEATPDRAPQVWPETPWAGRAVLRDGQPPQVEHGPSAGLASPAHAVLQLQTVDDQYRIAQAEALLAESWWARSFVPPSPWALLAWTFKVLPLAIGIHMTDLVHARMHRAREQAQPWARRLWHRLMAGLWLVLLTPAVIAALPIQAVLAASVVLSLLPVQVVQNAMRGLQSALIGTLGDSFLLVSSPVSRAMIVGQCKRDLQWLAGQCDEVMLVAHSQGCAVSYLALCEHRPAELTEVSWVGSGLRKLEVLRSAERNPRAVGAAWLLATMPLLVWALGNDLPVRGTTEGNGQRLFVIALLSAFWLGGFIGLLTQLRAGATDIWLRTWQTLKLRFWDIHASHDPVPHGPLSHEPLPPDGSLARQEVRNLASRLGDHVSYWRNVEEVVLPLALRIARAMGMPVDRPVPGDDAWRDAAAKRRHHRVQRLAWLRFAVYAGALGLVAGTLEHWLTLGQAAVAQGAKWNGFGGLDVGPLMPPVRTLLPLLLGWLVVPYTVVVLVWNGWDAHEQRAFLMRQQPDYWMELVVAMGLVGAALSPLARAVGTLGPAFAGAAIAVVLGVTLMAAFVHAADARRAFTPDAGT